MKSFRVYYYNVYTGRSSIDIDAVDAATALGCARHALNRDCISFNPNTLSITEL